MDHGPWSTGPCHAATRQPTTTPAGGSGAAPPRRVTACPPGPTCGCSWGLLRVSSDHVTAPSGMSRRAAARHSKAQAQFTMDIQHIRVTCSTAQYIAWHGTPQQSISPFDTACRHASMTQHPTILHQCWLSGWPSARSTAPGLTPRC